jgi:cyclopropane fatty-acyl-phospholipid synthase-like methyltransferase
MSNKTHWEKVYETKSPKEVSWTQEIPETSLRLIREANVPKDAAIIDIGGGDSKLVDFLLQEGFTNLTVLDISENSLERAKKRLKEKAEMVQWIVSDINEFNPTKKYAIWHDRAVFHFVTEEENIKRYVEIVSKYTTDHFIIGTFSENGPLKCSGLDIKQYNQEKLFHLFGHTFDLTSCFTEDHKTPFDTIQNFIFASFKTNLSNSLK